MRARKCKQVIDFDKSTTTVKEERNKTLQQQTTVKYNRFPSCLHKHTEACRNGTSVSIARLGCRISCK